MHRDHKLALSLGLLLIGVAAALCFPSRRDTDLAALQLEDTDQLDAAIDQLPVRVYTESHTDSGESGSVVDHSEQTATLSPDLADPFAGLNLLPAAPDPISTVDIGSATRHQVSDEETNSYESPRVSAWPDDTRIETTDTVTPHDPADRIEHEPLVYEVQPGDTLSGLAGRFLGSTIRYLDLYDANRDLLASPDDLQVGMLLTIPRQDTGDGNRKVRVASTPLPGEGDSSNAGAGSVASDSETTEGSPPGFRPAPHSPFAPRSDADRRTD